MTTAEIFKRNPSEKTFSQLYKEWEKPLYNYAKKITTGFFIYNPEKGNDVLSLAVSKTWQTVWEKIHQYNSDYKFNTWSFTIVRNYIFQEINKHKKKKDLRFDFSAPEEQMSYLYTESVEDLSYEAEWEFPQWEKESLQYTIVEEGIEQLSEYEQDLIYKIDFENVPYKTICDRDNKNLNTIKSRVRQARLKLTRHLKNNPKLCHLKD